MNPLVALEFTPALVRLLREHPTRLLRLAEAHTRWMLAAVHPDRGIGTGDRARSITTAMEALRDEARRTAAIEAFLSPDEAAQSVHAARIKTLTAELATARRRAEAAEARARARDDRAGVMASGSRADDSTEPDWVHRAVRRGFERTRLTPSADDLREVTREVYVEIETHAQVARREADRTARRALELPGPITPSARFRSEQSAAAIKPAVEALRQALFKQTAPPFPSVTPDERGWLAALTRAARWIRQQAAQQAPASPWAFRTSTLLAEAEQTAQRAARLSGAEYEVRLILRSLKFFAPVTAQAIKDGTKIGVALNQAEEVSQRAAIRRRAPRLFEVIERIGEGGLIVDSVRVCGPALEVTEAALRLADGQATVPPLWRLERRCAEWAERTGFTVPALVAYALTGLPPVRQAALLTLTTFPYPEMTLTVRTADVTEADLVPLWRRGRKELGFYRWKPTSDANLKLVERVHAAGGPPVPFLKREFWEKVKDPGETWRNAAERYRRTIFRETGRDPAGRRARRTAEHESG